MTASWKVFPEVSRTTLRKAPEWLKLGAKVQRQSNGRQGTVIRFVRMGPLGHGVVIRWQTPKGGVRFQATPIRRIQGNRIVPSGVSQPKAEKVHRVRVRIVPPKGPVAHDTHHEDVVGLLKSIDNSLRVLVAELGPRKE